MVPAPPHHLQPSLFLSLLQLLFSIICPAVPVSAATGSVVIYCDPPAYQMGASIGVLGSVGGEGKSIIRQGNGKRGRDLEGKKCPRHAGNRPLLHALAGCKEPPGRRNVFFFFFCFFLCLFFPLLFFSSSSLVLFLPATGVDLVRDHVQCDSDATVALLVYSWGNGRRGGAARPSLSSAHTRLPGTILALCVP